MMAVGLTALTIPAFANQESCDPEMTSGRSDLGPTYSADLGNGRVVSYKIWFGAESGLPALKPDFHNTFVSFLGARNSTTIAKMISEIGACDRLYFTAGLPTGDALDQTQYDQAVFDILSGVIKDAKVYVKQKFGTASLLTRRDLEENLTSAENDIRRARTAQ